MRTRARTRVRSTPIGLAAVPRAPARAAPPSSYADPPRDEVVALLRQRLDELAQRARVAQWRPVSEADERGLQRGEPARGLAVARGVGREGGQRLVQADATGAHVDVREHVADHEHVVALAPVGDVPGRVAGRIFFGTGWPRDWLELLVFVAAGVFCFAALGVAFSHAIPNFESTAAYVNAVFLPVVAVSFYAFDSSSAPGFVRTIADALPLKPLIQGLSAALVGGKGLGAHLDELAVLALWGVFGCHLAVRGFSWEQRRT